MNRGILFMAFGAAVLAGPLAPGLVFADDKAAFDMAPFTIGVVADGKYQVSNFLGDPPSPRGFRFRDNGPGRPPLMEVVEWVDHRSHFRLDLPIGPVRIKYGIPIKSDQFNDVQSPWNLIFDSPGAGYRQQRDLVR